MTHPRTDARKALIAILIAAATEAGSRVYDSMFWPSGAAESPSIIVFTPSDVPHEDEATPDAYVDLGAPRPQRAVTFDIRVRVTQTGDAPGKLDLVLRQIEQALDADRTLTSTVERSHLGETDIEGIEGTNPQALEGSLTWRAIYVDDFA